MTDFATPIEEAIVIMDRVRLFLADDDIEHISLPWDALKTTDWRSNERAAKIKAIEEHLGVFPDGSDVPLTIRQRIFFKDPLSRLQYKIQKARHESGEIVEVVTSFQSWEGDIKNTRLIRHFILECLSPFKRHTLEVTNAKYNEYPIFKSSWPVYISAWTFLSCTLCFFMYWIFSWGVYENDNTVDAWGSVYGTGAAKDVLLVQVTKIFIMSYLPAQAMQSQLLRIRNVLRDVTLQHLNGKDVNEVEEETNSSDVRNIQVAQHMSAACRAARSPELCDLPSAWLLRQVINLRVCQSVSVNHSFSKGFS